MDKQEVQRRLDRCNELILEIEDTLRDTDNRLRWDDPERQDWYLEKKEQLLTDLERLRAERARLLEEHSDLI